MLNAKTQSHCHEGKLQHKWPPVDILSHTNEWSTVEFHYYRENCLTTVSMNGSELTLPLLELKHTHTKSKRHKDHIQPLKTTKLRLRNSPWRPSNTLFSFHLLYWDLTIDL